MNIKDFITEAEKVRLDPKCWTGKKIGNPKTKVKGGVRVNNCVPAESVAEGSNDTIYPNAEVIKSKNGKPVGEIYQDGNSWGAFHYRADRGYDFIDSREEAIEALKDLHQETGRSRPNYTTKGVAEGSEYKSRHAHKQEQDKAYADYRTKHATSSMALMTRAEFAKDQRERAAKKKQGVAEGSNPEYDDEAGMADNNLETLKRTVEGIDDLIGAGDNLPEWCQEKIAVAKSMLVSVWDYMESEEESEDPEIAEMYEAMESLAEEIAHEDQISVDQVWETLERLDDQTLFETAAWRRKAGKSAKGGLNAKGVASYRRENPGSKLQMAVTTKPSKLKKGSKAAKRRKSFCARMSGVKGPMKKPNGKPTRKALALRKWNC